MKNLIYLFVIRGIQIVFPLITIPFLARHLDKINFALVILTQATGVLTSLIIEYGFNYSATRSIASVVQNKEQQSDIFTQVIYSKLILSIVCLFTVIIYSHFFIKIDLLYIIVVFLLALSQGFLPIWYFQGISKLKIPTISEIVSKVFIVIFTLMFLKKNGNAGTYLIFVVIFNMLSSFIQNMYIYKQLGLNRPSFSRIFFSLREGFNIFVFRLGSAFYTGGSLVFLGGVISPSIFASYAGADRIFRASAALSAPIGDAFFPRIVSYLSTDKARANLIRRQASIIILIFSGVLFCIVFFGASFIVKVLLGNGYSSTVGLLKILAFDIPLIAIGTIIGVFWLLAEKLDKYITFSVIIAGVWNIFAIFFLVPRLGISWMAISIIIAELIVILVGLCGIKFNRRKDE